MPGCVLRVSGSVFPVDTFLAGSGLAACKLWHAGDRVRKDGPGATSSGFNVVVSDAGDLATQTSEAILFLRRHREDLLRLVSIAEVDDRILDFGIEQVEAAAQFQRIPADLVRAAGEFGMSLELSLYAMS